MTHPWSSEADDVVARPNQFNCDDDDDEEKKKNTNPPIVVTNFNKNFN